MLGEKLSALLSTDNIAQYPWKRSAEIDYQVIVHVNRFDASTDEGIVLHARRTVLDPEGHVLVPTRGSKVSEPLTTQNYGSNVQAASRTVDQLSRQIAFTVSQIPSRSDSGGNHR